MNNLFEKKIIVGVTGSIAAYKSVLLVRELTKLGAEVKVIMTPSATNFITPLTFATISKHQVAISMYPVSGQEPSSGSWHIDLALWADIMIIAPATASTISKLATGNTDNALTIVASAMRAKIFVAPAMDSDMYEYPAFKTNIDLLKNYGMIVLPSPKGELASGIFGEGRMCEPLDIVKYLNDYFIYKSSLKGYKILVTAGPTYEPIDTVRYIGNYSSGKMGYEITQEALNRGAEVRLVTGPTSLKAPNGSEILFVTTAMEMYEAVITTTEKYDVIICSAAVSDYKPKNFINKKIKRRDYETSNFSLELVETQDILKYIGGDKKNNQLLVGFALESENMIENAKKKLIEKNCDLIVANPAKTEGAGFDVDTNIITLITEDKVIELPIMSKKDCAMEILNEIEFLLKKSNKINRESIEV
jgi:phosphopantothenoylcysteine decarboxylase/phosphopantothenate--cysteine ligase